MSLEEPGSSSNTLRVQNLLLIPWKAETDKFIENLKGRVRVRHFMCFDQRSGVSGGFVEVESFFSGNSYVAGNESNFDIVNIVESRKIL